MISQSFIVDFLGKSAGTLSDAKKKEPVNSGSYPKFIDTLNTAVDKNSSVRNDKNIRRSVDVNAAKSINEMKKAKVGVVSYVGQRESRPHDLLSRY